jgi:hypothetical protein
MCPKNFGAKIHLPGAKSVSIKEIKRVKISIRRIIHKRSKTQVGEIDR